MLRTTTTTTWNKGIRTRGFLHYQMHCLSKDLMIPNANCMNIWIEDQIPWTSTLLILHSFGNLILLHEMEKAFERLQYNNMLQCAIAGNTSLLILLKCPPFFCPDKLSTAISGYSCFSSLVMTTGTWIFWVYKDDVIWQPIHKCMSYWFRVCTCGLTEKSLHSQEQEQSLNWYFSDQKIERDENSSLICWR